MRAKGLLLFAFLLSWWSEVMSSIVGATKNQMARRGRQTKTQRAANNNNNRK